MFVPRDIPHHDKLAVDKRRLKGPKLDEHLRKQRERANEKHRKLDSVIGRLITNVPVSQRNQL